MGKECPHQADSQCLYLMSRVQASKPAAATSRLKMVGYKVLDLLSLTSVPPHRLPPHPVDRCGRVALTVIASQDGGYHTQALASW
jgi:hypothetical protein